MGSLWRWRWEENISNSLTSIFQDFHKYLLNAYYVPGTCTVYMYPSKCECLGDRVEKGLTYSTWMCRQMCNQGRFCTEWDSWSFQNERALPGVRGGRYTDGMVPMGVAMHAHGHRTASGAWCRIKELPFGVHQEAVVSNGGSWFSCLCCPWRVQQGLVPALLGGYLPPRSLSPIYVVGWCRKEAAPY